LVGAAYGPSTYRSYGLPFMPGCGPISTVTVVSARLCSSRIDPAGANRCASATIDTVTEGTQVTLAWTNLLKPNRPTAVTGHPLAEQHPWKMTTAMVVAGPREPAAHVHQMRGFGNPGAVTDVPPASIAGYQPQVASRIYTASCTRVSTR
jgi:hypothetical protein